MDTKLTLKLDKEIIELAKEYVKKRGTSISRMVEEYLKETLSTSKSDYPVTPSEKLLAMETGTDYVAKDGLSTQNPQKEFEQLHDQKLKEYLDLDKE